RHYPLPRKPSKAGRSVQGGSRRIGGSPPPPALQGRACTAPRQAPFAGLKREPLQALTTHSKQQVGNQTFEIALPITSARRRSCPIPSAYCFGSSAGGPSEGAFSGQLWTSMWTPSAPAATAAQAIAGIRSGRPVAWLGSTMIGR